MRKWVYIALTTLLLAAGIIVCAVRWQAWFGMPAEPVWTGDTLTRSFPTFTDDSVRGFIPTPRGWQDTIGAEQLNLLVLGDVHNRLDSADYDSIASRLPQIDAVVQLGDWIDRGYFYYYQLLLREYSRTPLNTRPVLCCPGNHEYTKGLTRHLAEDWQAWFAQPEDTTLQVPGVNYYVDFPCLRFIVIDSNPLDRLVWLTRTLTWLRQAMNTADGRFVVVMMHHPVIPAGKGRFCPLIYSTFRYALGQADLVFTGHDHSYMRRMPFVETYAAGKPKPQRTDIRCNFAAEEQVYSLLTVEPSVLTLRTYRLEDGVLIDSVYVKHD